MTRACHDPDCMTSVFHKLAGAAVLGSAMMLGLPAMADDITITHPQGETVIAERPEKVIVTDWAVFDNLHALGVEVAGVPSSNAPSYLVDLVGDDLLRVGSLQEPDVEGIVAADPDLLIVAARSRTSYPVFENLVPVMDASIDNDDLIASVEAQITQFGEIFAVEDAAAKLVENLDAKVTEAREAAEGKGSALVIVTNGGKLGIYGPGSRISWAYNELGLPSVFDDVDDRDHGGDAISFEYLLETNPDWLLVVDRDAAIGNEGAARQLLDNQLIHQTKFWENDQIIYLDPEAAYISMHGYDGLMLLLDQIIAGFGGEAAEG